MVSNSEIKDHIKDLALKTALNLRDGLDRVIKDLENGEEYISGPDASIFHFLIKRIAEYNFLNNFIKK